jgi:CBS domain-containing protein
MNVREIMTCPVHSVPPTESMAQAAHLMAEVDVGILPVEDEGRLVGVVTDRDIAVRGVACGLHGGAPVLRVMTDKVVSCRDDDDVEDALAVMARQQIRRMPVCNEEGTLIGMLTLADAARNDRNREEVADTLGDICRPQGHHSQVLATS